MKTTTATIMIIKEITTIKVIMMATRLTSLTASFSFPSCE